MRTRLVTLRPFLCFARWPAVRVVASLLKAGSPGRVSVGERVNGGKEGGSTGGGSL